MNEYKRFRLAIASIHRGQIFFNVYDSLDDFHIVGFAAYNMNNGTIITNVKDEAFAMSELFRSVSEEAKEIENVLN